MTFRRGQITARAVLEQRDRWAGRGAIVPHFPRACRTDCRIPRPRPRSHRARVIERLSPSAPQQRRRLTAVRPEADGSGMASPAIHLFAQADGWSAAAVPEHPLDRRRSKVVGPSREVVPALGSVAACSRRTPGIATRPTRVLSDHPAVARIGPVTRASERERASWAAGSRRHPATCGRTTSERTPFRGPSATEIAMLGSDRIRSRDPDVACKPRGDRVAPRPHPSDLHEPPIRFSTA